MANKTILIRNAAATDFGGAERVPVFLARELKALGVEALVVSGSKKLLNFAKSHNVTNLRSPWLPLQNWSGIRALLFPIYLVWQLLLYAYYFALFAIKQPDTVHIQSKDDFIAGTLAAKTLGISVFWSDYADLKHVWMNHRIWYKNPVGKLVYRCAQFAETIIVVSNQDMKNILQLIPEGKVSKKLRVIYNGAFDHYIPHKKHDKFTYISTGRLVTDKGIAELVTAFNQLHGNYPNTKLLLVGDGPEREKFEKLAGNNSAIEFLGHQSDPTEYLALSDVFVLPTYHEGFSLALVEACMEELAIIATNVGGNPEIIIDNKNGLLISVKNVEQLHTAMVRLLEDNKLREALSKNARKDYLKYFNFKSIIIKDFLPLYSKGGR